MSVYFVNMLTGPEFAKTKIFVNVGIAPVFVKTSNVS